MGMGLSVGAALMALSGIGMFLIVRMRGWL